MKKTKLLKFVGEETAGASYIYAFEGEEGEKYRWKSRKKHWFDKRESWLLSFEVVNFFDGAHNIKNCRQAPKH